MVFRHVLPQIAPLLIANTVLCVAIAIFDETSLDFLGLGAPNGDQLGHHPRARERPHGGELRGLVDASSRRGSASLR